MVQADLSSILAVSPDEMSPQEKEDLFENIAYLDLEPNLPPDKLKGLFEISQQILKYKGEQVESLLSELDVLAGSAEGSDEIREELVKSRRQNEQLVEELERKDEELLRDKGTIEKLSQQLSDVERDKKDLNQEVIALRQERLANFGGEGQEGDAENVEQLKETLQQKNRHILQLLTDIEAIERENESLSGKVNGLRREVSEATGALTKLSGENISLREANYQDQEKINGLEERNSALASQVCDLMKERNEQDAKLDQLIDALEARVAKWQEILSHKDNELADLQSRLEQLQSTNVSQQFTNYGILSQTLTAHEDKIKHLEAQLGHATKDLQESTQLLQEFRKKAEARDSSEESDNQVQLLREELEKSQAQLVLQEERLKDAEQDAQARAEEMTEMIIQLREYEEGRYGLKEAREEIQDLKKRVTLRDRQIERLVQQANQLHIQLGDKITLSPGDLYTNEEEEEIPETLDTQGLRTQLQQVQQTAINLSMQNYDLKAQVIKLTEEISKDKSDSKPVEKVEEIIQTDLEKDIEEPAASQDEDVKSTEDRLDEVISENESLRKGLHEILESIHHHDGASTVSIESECLESLLEALDSRSVSGWYHPAMRLQAALNKMQGTNQALRQQIRESRLRESYFQAELQTSMIRVEELEDIVTKSSLPRSSEMIHPPIPPPRRTLAAVSRASSQDLPDNGIAEANADENNENNSAIKSSQSSGRDRTSDSPAEVPNEVDGGNESVHEEVTADVNVEQNDAETQTDTTSEDNNIGREIRKIQRSEASVGTNGVILTQEEQLMEKCENLRKDLEDIRVSTSQALDQMTVNREQLSQEIRQVIKKVEEKLSSSPSKSLYLEKNGEPVLAEFERELADRRMETEELKLALSEKDAELKAKESHVNELRQKVEELNTVSQDETQTQALKTTVNSLQNLIAKKEEVIVRYQKLIQENSEEYNKLMDQYKTLESHTKRLPSPTKDKLTDSRAITLLMEKWLGRVHALEDQVCALAQQLTQANSDIDAAQQECLHWKSIAHKVDEKQSSELQEVLEERKKEIDELRTSIDQIKLEYEMKSKERLRSESIKFRKKEDDYKSKIRMYESEVARLKQHSRNSTYKPSITTKKEYLLLDKIKSLEEELQQYRTKEQSILQLRRDRCAEEVSKWEEKKKMQSITEKLKSDLKEKNTQLESMEMQVSRLKVIISRMERERIALQRRLKMSQESITKMALNPGSRESRTEPEEVAKNVYDSGMETSPVGNTPRSRTESSGESVTNDESKSGGRSRQDLEKAVVALKKVISKLRSEKTKVFNKEYVEQLQQELKKTQENYVDSVDRIMNLEEKLKQAESEMNQLRESTYIVDKGGERNEVMLLREQLTQKSDLLSKVKVLLQRAMLRERHLMDQIAVLRGIVPAERLDSLTEDT